MSKGFRLRFVFIVFVFCSLIFCPTSFLRSEEVSKGSILGFVYDEGGTTPLLSEPINPRDKEKSLKTKIPNIFGHRRSKQH